ncbi:LLM class flavin-dependent oxidoreductase [Aquipuribacter nitratireducens]|uniref:LLM class flavin-dependent oxidoreductase n=1 Tax=Aquipuribacter nitratireducens TaxID=650104 RepID=A0ABW0GRI3_9MICO
MTDYGHDLRFGFFLTPTAAEPERVLALATLSEQLGLDYVTVQDHPYQSQFLDTWTLLTWLAARTDRVSLVPNVLNLPLRPPAVLARSVATLDVLSGGRVELGLGTGAFWDGIAAMGGPRLAPGEAVTALEEAIAVLRGLWDTSTRSVTVDGTHHRVVGARPGPAPAHDVGVWVGGYKPRMLRLVGRLADGWLPSSPYAPPEQLATMNERIDEAAVAAGRDPADVRRLYNIGGTFGRGTGGDFLQGPPEVWVEQLAELALADGMSGFVAMGDDPDHLRRFAAEVVPAVRELVDAERRRTRTADATDDATDDGGSRPLATTTRPEVRGTVPTTEAPGGPPPGLGVTPTADDGTRLSTERVWDEADRPSASPPDPDRTYTAHERAAGQHLVDVHDHLRTELARLRDLVEQVASGAVDPGAARSHVATMTIRQNRWTVGAYCVQYCRVVTGHHTLEDESVFPHLRGADPALAPVIDRLEVEHHAIHDVLERVDRALVAFVGDPDGPQTLQQAVDLLTDALLSHLAYEERELVEPLARLGFY